ncbi:enoyl-ACP reductase [Buchnera aphidicola (Macrosiphoniella sanborni)]|uniref:Enoyl-[acyl-carrier-protein] reductase [NADH] n=1 Tax=Buchnera aphidicola (Macrosiphoniella sanborni) TaxID=1241865 RepID=A0A4D6YHH9_9GAMM|nr:enoyl-ACP reductase [Buchnera aphidicola]QCI23805.1 enoyl-ACP reductase [Buchnera aphidicola (Macrosiphoniella sanborni)]
MSFLKGKKILITGVSSSRSIAFGIAKSLYYQQAELGFVCQNKKIKNKIKDLANSVKSRVILSCDVSKDQEIKSLFINLRKTWKKFDGLVHSIAYCPKEHLNGDFITNTTRQGFNIAHEISSFSFIALVKECKNMLNNFSSLLTLSYLGAQRVIQNYNVMGLSKASLEASVRYMAYSLGKKNIRVNAISSGPIKTISSHKIKDFNKIKNFSYSSACIKQPITIENIGNVASFLLSNLSFGITGSVIYVDNGFNINSMYIENIL